MIPGADPKIWHFEVKTQSIFERKIWNTQGDQTNEYELVGRMEGAVKLDMRASELDILKVSWHK